MSYIMKRVEVESSQTLRALSVTAVTTVLCAGCLVALVWGTTNARAQTNAEQKKDVEKIMQIMATKQFEEKSETPFCQVFFRDFQTMNNIRFATPVARAESYDDAALAPFKAQCGEQPLNEYFACDGRATAGLKWDADPGKRRQQYLEHCSAYIGTRNFKVFRIDANNNPKDGEEIVVYFEAARGPANRPAETTVTANGGYYAYSAKNCAPVDSSGTNDPYAYFFERPVENYNGLISYHGKTYVFDLYDLGAGKNPANPSYSLHVSTLNKDRREWCSYSTLSIRRALEENRKSREKKAAK